MPRAQTTRCLIQSLSRYVFRPKLFYETDQINHLKTSVGGSEDVELSPCGDPTCREMNCLQAPSVMMYAYLDNICYVCPFKFLICKPLLSCNSRGGEELDFGSHPSNFHPSGSPMLTYRLFRISLIWQAEILRHTRSIAMTDGTRFEGKLFLFILEISLSLDLPG